MGQSIARNLARIQERIASACRKAGRRAEDVTLVAVTKSVGVEEIEALAALGIRHVGESRVQAGLEKRPRVGASLMWHMVGHLQTNKAGRAVEQFDVLHSLDRLRLAEALSRRLEETGRTWEVYLEVNLTREPQKSGMAAGDVPALLEALRRDHPRLRPAGLMTMGPETGDAEASRPVFEELRRLARREGLAGLSMGMSRDFVVAVEEGATVVRVGRALFEAEVPCPS